MNIREQTIRHLEMVQGTINRMAHCSFLLKGWSITLTTAGALINVRTDNSCYMYAYLVFPILLFWILDGFFVNQERLFRHLYDSIRKKKNSDFSMQTDYSKSNWCRVCLSKTLSIFYFPLILMNILFCYFILKANS